MPEGSFVDVGCGSGVLAIVAAALGFDPVTALDYDPAAVAATQENALRNGVTLDARLFDLRRDQVPDGDLVAANVLAGPLVAWAAHQRRLPAQLILSGILTTEADRVAAAFAHARTQRSRRRDGASGLALAAQLVERRNRVDNARARNLGHGADAAGARLIDPSTRRL